MTRVRQSPPKPLATGLSATRAWLDGIESPVRRAHAAQAVLAALQDALADIGAVKRGALRDMYADGWTITDIATEFQFSRARAHDIVNR